MNRKFIIASFNLYWNGSPNSWDNAAQQVLRSENESKVYYYIVLFQLKWFSEQDSALSIAKSTVQIRSKSSSDAIWKTMRCTATGRKCQSFCTLPAPNLYPN